MGQGLAGRHAVVTGGGRGIGAAIAEALVAEGVALTLLGRDAARLEAQAAALQGRGRVETAAADVTSAGEVAAAFAQARERIGPVDILVNNAGAAESAPFAKTDPALWERMIAVNLTGAFLCCREVVPGMIAAKYGRIVTIASVAGLQGYPYVAAYCAAKHGVIGLTRALALETARANVTVNAICPGYTETDMVAETVRNIVAKTGRGEDEARAALVSAQSAGAAHPARRDRQCRGLAVPARQ